jgi:hypothetical protein
VAAARDRWQRPGAVQAVVGRGGGIAATSSGGLTSVGAAASHNRVRVSVSVVGFITGEIRMIQDGGWTVAAPTTSDGEAARAPP